MTLTGYGVTLRDIEEADLALLRQWRNDPEISQYMLSQEKISAEQQLAWFKKMSRDPAQQHWIIEYQGEPIGSCNIKALYSSSLQSVNTVEPGLYIGDARYRGNILAFSPTLLMNDFCFNSLAVKQLKAVVKSTNVAALKYNEKIGYKRQSGTDLLCLTLTLQDYLSATTMLRALLSRQKRASKANA